MDKLSDVTEEQLEYAIDAVATLAVDEICRLTGIDQNTAIYEFLNSKTAAILYDEPTKVWRCGPAYVAEMYMNEKNLV